jgi:hypothetical protein
LDNVEELIESQALVINAEILPILRFPLALDLIDDPVQPRPYMVLSLSPGKPGIRVRNCGMQKKHHPPHAPAQSFPRRLYAGDRTKSFALRTPSAILQAGQVYNPVKAASRSVSRAASLARREIPPPAD